MSDINNRIIEILQSNAVKLSWTHLVAFPQPVNCGAMGNAGVTQTESQFGRGSIGVQGCYGSQGYFGLQGHFGTQGHFGSQGIIGKTGTTEIAENGKTYRIQPVPRTEMPETLQFIITCLEPTVYATLSSLLHQFLEPAIEQINICNVTEIPSRPIPRPVRLKEEFLSVWESKKAAFAARKEKVDLLIEMATEYGAKFEDGYYVDTRDELSMPPDAYEQYGPQSETNGEIKILCRKTSKIYKLLDDAGFIQQYCPEEYRRGDSYSVNGGPMHTQPTEKVLVQ